MIQYNNENTFKEIRYNGHSIKSVYDYQANKVWPTIPSVYKWLATYSDGSVTNAECDSTSAITSGEVSKTNLVAVSIGDCVTTIGDSAFEAADALSSLTIPDSVTSIGEYTFIDCISLTSIVIPNSVTTIGGDALSDCTSLTSITVNATTPPTLGSYAFFDTNNCPIYVPCGSLAAYQTAWSEYSSRITCRKVYETQYFTVRMLQNNSILTFTKGNRFDYDLQYSLDSGTTWNVYESQLYNLSSGSTVMFKGSISFDNHDNSGVGKIYSNYKYEVEGNIMSLLFGDNFANKTVLQYDKVFMNLFYSNPYLLNIDNLVMPATTLTEECYIYMFGECRSIVKAPQLLATTLAEGCYQGMFSNCINLNEVTCLATDLRAINCTANWLENVASSGTFKAASSTYWTTGDSGIPNGWTRV